MTNLEIMTVAFSALGDTELRREKRYVDAGKKFLCGKDNWLFCKDGMG